MSQQSKLSLLRQYVTVHGDWFDTDEKQLCRLEVGVGCLLWADGNDKRIVYKLSPTNNKTRKARAELNEDEAARIWNFIKTEDAPLHDISDIWVVR